MHEFMTMSPTEVGSVIAKAREAFAQAGRGNPVSDRLPW